MKKLLLGAAAAWGLMLLATPASAGCSACAIQTKVASTTVAGKFDYKVTCLDDRSGDEVTSTVTAATDEEASQLAAARCTP